MFLQANNISKTYPGGIKALNDVSLGIRKGETMALLGVNGTGKTTLSSIIATLIPPTSGDVLHEGQSIYKDINSFRRLIGFCPQKPNLNNQLTVAQNLYYDGVLYGFSQHESCETMEKLIVQFKLEKYRDAYPNVLSGGYKQRVMIARALMHQAQLVIFDEPTVALDPHIRHQLWDIIKELDATIILTTHYLEEAEALADRICILDNGKVLLVDTPDNLKAKHDKKNLEAVFIQLIQEETT